jgi:DnaK suppressor protein
VGLLLAQEGLGFTQSRVLLGLQLTKGSAMKKKDIDTLKAILEEEKKRITRHLEEISDSSVADLDTASGDSVDIASLEINQNALQKIGKREVNHLKKIDAALKKVEDGTYGECEVCGEDIAVARLMARPVAQLCIDCKTDQEMEERRYSDRDDEEDGDGFPEESEEI